MSEDYNMVVSIVFESIGYMVEDVDCGFCLFFMFLNFFGELYFLVIRGIWEIYGEIVGFLINCLE